MLLIALANDVKESENIQKQLTAIGVELSTMGTLTIAQLLKMFPPSKTVAEIKAEMELTLAGITLPTPSGFVQLWLVKSGN